MIPEMDFPLHQETLNCPDIPRELEKGIPFTDDDSDRKEDGLVVVMSPIPATAWVSVDYTLPTEQYKATMVLVNPMGIKVLEVKLDGCKGSETLDLRSIPSGVYSYIVRCGDSFKTGKLVVAK